MKFQTLPEKDKSLIKHQLRGPCGEYMSTSEKTKKTEEGMISESKPEVWKVESDKEDSDFECYNNSEGKPVHVDFEKEVADRSKPTFALLPSRSEECKINNNSETRDGDGNISLRRSDRIFKPPEWFGSVSYFEIEINF